MLVLLLVTVGTLSAVCLVRLRASRRTAGGEENGEREYDYIKETAAKETGIKLEAGNGGGEDFRVYDVIQQGEVFGERRNEAYGYVTWKSRGKGGGGSEGGGGGSEGRRGGSGVGGGEEDGDGRVYSVTQQGELIGARRNEAYGYVSKKVRSEVGGEESGGEEGIGDGRVYDVIQGEVVGARAYV